MHWPSYTQNVGARWWWWSTGQYNATNRPIYYWFRRCGYSVPMVNYNRHRIVCTARTHQQQPTNNHLLLIMVVLVRAVLEYQTDSWASFGTKKTGVTKKFCYIFYSLHTKRENGSKFFKCPPLKILKDNGMKKTWTLAILESIKMAIVLIVVI